MSAWLIAVVAGVVGTAATLVAEAVWNAAVERAVRRRVATGSPPDTPAGIEP